MNRYLFLVVAAAVAALLGLAATFKLMTSGDDEAAGGRGRGGAVQVAIETVGREEFSDVVEALGTARANESVTITSKVTDVISRIAFDSGDEVEAGDVLAELADAEEAADLAEARATLNETLRELERFEELQSRGVASAQRIDELRSGVDRARARVRAIEARLADRIIRAPFQGVIGLRNASPGMLVRPGDPIATLDDVSVMKLDFTVPERFLADMTRGSTMAARAAAYPDDLFIGEVDHMDSRVDPVTRSVVVRAIVPNDDRRLRPGMLLVVEVTRDLRTSLSVPELALSREGDQAFVFVVEENDAGAQVSRRNVTTGTRRGGRIEITSGLMDSDAIVSEGVHRLRDGSAVVIARRQDAPEPTEREGGA